ncbi:hypothetical protein BH11ARM1_BH11ARM1_12850 [soil metagenome]
MPDTCTNCGRPAEFQLAEAGVESLLCGACAAEKSNYFEIKAFHKAFVRPRQTSGPCPHCGTTQQDVEGHAIVGCPLCYEVFGRHIDALLAS